MQRITIEIGLCFIYALLPYVMTIDCYHCTSHGADHKECEDQFRGDITTEHLISRNCFYGIWRAHYCIKLKGTRENGKGIIVRQCSVKDWGSHCGAIQFDAGDNRIEMIEGCLETCDYDGCNLATTINTSASGNTLLIVFCSAVIYSIWRAMVR